MPPIAASVNAPPPRLDLAAKLRLSGAMTDGPPDATRRDVLASLSGISLAAGEPAQRDQARRLLDLLMDGLRYRGSTR